MIISNYLSRQKHDDSNTHEIIPVLFNMQSVLQSRYYNFDEGKIGKYFNQMRSQVKSSGIKLPEAHEIEKGLDLNILPEKQIMKPLAVTKAKEVSQIKPRLGQGRADLRCKIKTPMPTPISTAIAQMMKRTVHNQKSKYPNLLEYRI